MPRRLLDGPEHSTLLAEAWFHRRLQNTPSDFCVAPSLVDEGDQHFARRSSSAWAKNAAAFFLRANSKCAHHLPPPLGDLGRFLIIHAYVTIVGPAWVNRRFFREAYEADAILGDLASKVRTILETGPLLETVANH